MNNANGRPQRLVHELLADYTHCLRTHLEEIEALWAECLIDGWSMAHATRLRDQCHAVARSAATFGHAQASHLAGLAEERFIAALEDGNVHPPHFEQLREAVEALLAVPGPRMAGNEPSPRDDLGVTPHEAPQQQATPTTASDRLAEQGGSIYVVEDDQAFADHIVEQLSLHGYNAHTFTHPGALEQALRGGLSPPAAVVTDVIFPSAPKAGVAMAQRLREELDVKVPILYVSRDECFETRLEIIRAGGDAFFVKPLNFALLLERLDQIAGQETQDPLRVLVIDDDDVFGGLTCAILEGAGIDARTLTHPAKAIDAILDYRPDLVLLDVYMPDVNGMELAQILRQHESCRDLPILFLSAETDPGRQAAALNIGVDGFLTKPIDHTFLVAAVANRAERARALRRKVYRDGLTHLLVHDEIRNQLANQLSTAQRHDRPLAYAMIDIDYFKRINDSYGHATGDQVLENMSALLRRSFRRGDVLGRYGGEEFVVILQDTDLEDAVMVIERLRQDFAQLRHRSERDQKEFSATFSAGVSAYPEFETAMDLQNRADDALYRAKGLGRNRVCRAQQSRPSGDNI